MFSWWRGLCKQQERHSNDLCEAEGKQVQYNAVAGVGSDFQSLTPGGWLILGIFKRNTFLESFLV